MPTRSPDKAPLVPLEVLVGEWRTEMRHPMLPDVTVRGRATFEWLEGGWFLVQRAQTDHPDFPDSCAVIGLPSLELSPPVHLELTLQYFDSRGVHRIYEAGMRDRVWRMERLVDPVEAPEQFSQRFVGTVADDDDGIDGLWTSSLDGTTWEDDLAITFRRA